MMPTGGTAWRVLCLFSYCRQTVGDVLRLFLAVVLVGADDVLCLPVRHAVGKAEGAEGGAARAHPVLPCRLSLWLC